MTIRSSSRPASGVAAALLACMIAACSADRPLAPSAALRVPGFPSSSTLLRWSDPNSWPTHTVPAAGADVTIPQQDTIVLDGTTPVLGALTIQGTLVVDTGVVAIRASRIDVLGHFEAGASQLPYTGQFTVTLVERPGDQSSDTKGIIVHDGGQLDLYGEPRVMWTHLAADVAAGSEQLQLADPVDWHAGDRLVVAPSGFDYHQVDLATVRKGSTNTVTLTAPLQYAHAGTIQVMSGMSVDERAEVGLLSHNILIQGDSLSEAKGHGGHVMILHGGSAHVDGVELYRMGQRGHMGRYPFHWHLAGSVPGQFIRNSSVWHSFNRCTTIHGTDDALVENNVCFDHEGHGYFLEDGIETGNTLKHNFATYARPGSLLPSDDSPASFWISNPDNSFIGNVAAGAAIGYWFTPPLHPTGPSATAAVWPAYTPIRAFDGNVAHSAMAGISMEEDHREAAPGFGPHYSPRVGGLPGGAAVTNVLTHYTAYADGRAFWLRGDHQQIDSSVLADNGIGVMMGEASLAIEGVLSNSVVVGRTGNPLTSRADRVVGVLLYDGPVSITHTTFVNFAAAHDAAIGGYSGTGIRVSPRFTADHVTLMNARPVYLPVVGDSSGFGSVRDVDGSLTGKPGGVVIPADGFLSDSTCTAVPDWNAEECTTPYVAVGILGAYDLTSTVISKDGVPMHTWTGANGPDLSVTVPVGHAYDFAPPGLTTSYHFEVDGLPRTGGAWVIVSGPWRAATARIVSSGLPSTDPLPFVTSLDALAHSSIPSAYYDRSAGKVYVKVLGSVAPQVELWVTQQ